MFFIWIRAAGIIIAVVCTGIVMFVTMLVLDRRDEGDVTVWGITDADLIDALEMYVDKLLDFLKGQEGGFSSLFRKNTGVMCKEIVGFWLEGFSECNGWELLILRICSGL